MFCNETATTEIYTLSLHDALPIFGSNADATPRRVAQACIGTFEGEGSQDPAAVLSVRGVRGTFARLRSEEHTSELQSRHYLVCRLLLAKNHSRRPIPR